MKRNARERDRELRFTSVLESETGGLLRLMRPVFRRIVRRAVRLPSSLRYHMIVFQQAEAGQTGANDNDDDDDDDDEDEDLRRHTYSFDCAPS